MLHSSPIQSYMMFSSSSYQEQFPPLEKQTNPQIKVTTKPFVHSPVTPNGQLEELKPFEAVLNWQTQNARAQNSAFKSLNEKIEKVTSQVKQTHTKVDRITTQLEQMYFDMQNRVSQLDSDLRSMIQNRYWGPEFNQKEAEIRQLKAELARIKADKQQPSLFAKSPALPLHTLIFSTYQPFYTPSTSRQPVDYAIFFGLSHLKHTPTPAPPKPRSKPPKPKTPPTYHQPSDPQSSPKPQSTQKNKEHMHQYSSQVLPYLSELNETSPSQTEETSIDDESFSISDSEKELVGVSKLLMVQPSTRSNEPSPSSPPQTPIIEEADFDTNSAPHQEKFPPKPSNGP